MNHNHDDDESKGRQQFFTDAVSADVPLADTFQVMRCLDTSHAHIVLFDERGEPFAQLIVTPDNVDTIVRECEGILTLPRVQ